MHVAPVKMIMGVDLSVQFIMKSFEKNVYSSFRSQYCAAVLNYFHDIGKVIYYGNTGCGVFKRGVQN